MPEDPAIETLKNHLKDNLKIIVRPVSADIQTSSRDGSLLRAEIKQEICIFLGEEEISCSTLNIEL